MSALAGICHWDGAPVSEAALTVLEAHSRVAGPNGGGTVTPMPWVALQAHVLRFDRRSATERQPFISAQGSVVTWDGRLDSREDLLLQLHHNLGPDLSDAALVAAAYDRWGLDCLPRLIGDWSLAIWDAARQMLILARDYMGNRPLHYLETCHGVAWATRLDALAACFNLYAQPSDAYIAGRLTIGVPPGLTPFRGVHALRGGHVLVSRRASGIGVRRYWTFSPATIRYQQPRDYADRMREHLANAVRLRLRAERTVWAHLSGGWDSSSLVCLAHVLTQRGNGEAPAIQPVTSFSSDAETEDRGLVEAVERWCGLSTVRCQSVGYPRFAELLGKRRPVPINPRLPVETPVQTAGDLIVLGGEPGDIVMMADTSHRLALLEPLHDGHILRSLRLCSRRARHMNRSLSTVLVNVVREAYIESRRRASPRRRKVTNVFGLTPALLAHVPPGEAFAIPSTVDFPIVKRLMVMSLYWHEDRSASGNAESAPDVWHTFPYTHRPLVEFMLAVPISAFWDPVVHRAGMNRALADILPPELLARSAKATNPGGGIRWARQKRAEDLISESADIGPVEDWELVSRGYVEASALTQALSAFQNAPTIARNVIRDDFLFPCLHLEAWLRTLTAMPRHAATTIGPSHRQSFTLPASSGL